LLCLVLLLSASTFTPMQVGLVSSADSAETAENSWVSKAPMQQARGGLGVAVLNGKIYTIGGSSASGSYSPDISGEFVDTNEEYDPATGTWAFKASMPTPRAHFAIAVYQNKVYCVGGTVDIGKDPMYGVLVPTYINSGVNEVYDPTTDTWETKTPMPIVQRGLQANVVGDKIYLTGAGSWEVYNLVYNPAKDTWVTIANYTTPMPSGVTHYASAVFEDKIYVVAVDLYSIQTMGQLLIYDVANDSWSQGTRAPFLFHGGAAVTTTGLMAPKRIYVFGISVNSSYNTQVYDPITDSWKVGADTPTLRADSGIAVINDTFYVIGGYAASIFPQGYYTASKVNEQYIPFGYDTVPPAVSVVSPENRTYGASDVALTFIVNKPVSSMSYSLDGATNATATGNATLTGLTNGLHNVTVYATDALGNTGASETITFTIAEETQAAPFPTATAAASLAVIALVSVSLAAYYFTKVRRKNEKPKNNQPSLQNNPD